jgi:5-methylcytosine-specific restriction endonuclease McrA
MKRCTVCKTEHPKDAFNVSRRRPDGLQNVCRECNRTRAKRYYTENKVQHRAKIHERRGSYIVANRDILLEYLKTHPCVACGETDPLVLDFDHLRDKQFDLGGDSVRTRGRRSIENEMAKCQVLCANCHRRKTHEQQNTWKWRSLRGTVA